MNLLISISFAEEVRENLMGVMESLKKCSRKGRFNNRYNLRMNLVSLRDIDDIRPIQRAVDAIDIEPFDIIFDRLDRSRRDGGDIYWAAAQKNEVLEQLYQKVLQIVCDNEYEYDEKPFKQRVELGHMIIARPDFKVSEFSALVDNITLIKYVELRSRTIYKELYRKNFLKAD